MSSLSTSSSSRIDLFVLCSRHETQHFLPTPHFQGLNSWLSDFLIVHPSAPCRNTAHTICFMTLTFSTLLMFLSFQILVSSVAFCRANAAHIFKSLEQSPVAVLYDPRNLKLCKRSQKFETLYLFQLLPSMIHFQLHALLSADHHYLRFSCIYFHVIVLAFCHQVLEVLSYSACRRGDDCCIIGISQVSHPTSTDHRPSFVLLFYSPYNVFAVYIKFCQRDITSLCQQKIDNWSR